MLKLKIKPKGKKITIYLPEKLSDQELEVTIFPVKKKKKSVRKGWKSIEKQA